jgi:[ribosomal protein S5]-alanine N-acetyltransferase
VIGWPVTLVEGDIRLRPLRIRDARAWRDVRARNSEWLTPWDATLPVEGSFEGEAPPTFGAMVRRMNREARAGRMLPWALDVDGVFRGQVTVGGIAMGSLRGGYIGYWIDQEVAGRGIMTTAVAMASDYLIGECGLHRVEINIRPENEPSRRVAEKLGLRNEGIRKSYLHINGQWCDHVSYVLLAGDQPDGVLRRLRSQQLSQ